jgi:hypothetical protein
MIERWAARGRTTVGRPCCKVDTSDPARICARRKRPPMRPSRRTPDLDISSPVAHNPTDIERSSRSRHHVENVAESRPGGETLDELTDCVSVTDATAVTRRRLARTGRRASTSSRAARRESSRQAVPETTGTRLTRRPAVRVPRESGLRFRSESHRATVTSRAQKRPSG